MTPAPKTFLCFCSLPTRDRARDAEFAIASAIVIEESILSSKEFQNEKLLSHSSGLTLFSCVITNRRYRTYKTDDKDTPHILLLSMLLERVGYYRRELKGAFNTFLPSDREPDYMHTLARLLKSGVAEEWYGFGVEKDVFQGINPAFLDKSPLSISRFFAAGETLNTLLRKKLLNEFSEKDHQAWKIVRSKYYSAKSGALNGYGIKIYPDENFYHYL